LNHYAEDGETDSEDPDLTDYFTLLDDKFDVTKAGMTKNSGTGPSFTTAKNVIEKKHTQVEKKSSGFPSGTFRHQGLKVVFAKEGTSLLALASQHHIQLSSLLKYNEFPSGMTEVEEDQLVYLQYKRKTGKKEYHQVKKGETLREISQTEGIRLYNLMQLNKLKVGMEPKVGQKLALKTAVRNRPLLAKIMPSKSKESTTIHVVKRGESLTTIAQRYKVSVDSIKEVNNMKRDELQVGQTLRIQK
jgi:LysM repeat protein